MMSESDVRKARQTEATEKLNALLSEYADALGPNLCEVHGDECDGSEDTCVLRPVDNVMCGSWILCTEWSSMVEREGYWDYTVSEFCSPATAIGLMTLVSNSIG